MEKMRRSSPWLSMHKEKKGVSDHTSRSITVVGVVKMEVGNCFYGAQCVCKNVIWRDKKSFHMDFWGVGMVVLAKKSSTPCRGLQMKSVFI